MATAFFLLQAFFFLFFRFYQDQTTDLVEAHLNSRDVADFKRIRPYQMVFPAFFLVPPFTSTENLGWHFEKPLTLFLGNQGSFAIVILFNFYQGFASVVLNG